MNARRQWVWVGYWAGVSVLILVLLGVSGQVLTLERAEARSRARTAQQESTRLALWRMDSWLAPVLAREARRPYFEYRPRLPVGRAYENMWDPIEDLDPVVPSPLITGVPELTPSLGSLGERLIRLHLQIEPDGDVTSPQHPSDAELVDLIESDPFVAMGTAERDRAGAILSVLRPIVQAGALLEARLDTRNQPGADRADAPDAPSASAMLEDAIGEPHRLNETRSQTAINDRDEAPMELQDAVIGGYADRQRVFQLAQQNESPEQYLYQNKLGGRSNAADVTEDLKLVFDGDDASPAESLGDVVGELGFAESERVAAADTEGDNLAREQGAGASGDLESLGKARTERAAEEAGETRLAGDEASAEQDTLETATLAGNAPPSFDYTDADAEKKEDQRRAIDLASGTAASDEPGGVRISVGPLTPSWLSSVSGQPELVYLRTVRIGEAQYQQGMWLNWRVLREALLESGEGLPEQARLDPVPAGTPPDTAQQLATVPAVLRWPAASAPYMGMTPARWSLLLTWLAVIISMGAIGVVLRAAMRLSDRRVRFVGAVTHELRTPLTTFRLYSQMLADGMVTEESARREYLNTLKDESGRLAGIVENVLAYARLNRAGREPNRVRTEVMTPESLLVRLRPGLSRRAEQSGMDLIVSNEAGDQGSGELLVDPQSVERILTNLVDNACKYAPGITEDDPAGETRIHLDLRVVGETLEILVADYGPGIDPGDRAKVFGEFQRGRAGQRADRSGLGLGLALSRGLARESGGDLRLVRRRGHGAEFLLTLPMQPGATRAG